MFRGNVARGMTRRSWARNENAMETAVDWNKKHQGDGHITSPFQVEELVERDF